MPGTESASDTKTSNLSKKYILYPVPMLSLTSFLLNLFVFLAPTILFHDDIYLARVTPALVNFSTNTSLDAVREPDGPSVVVGMLGSCARASKNESFLCSHPSFTGPYDTSVLPREIPDFLTAPGLALPLCALLALSLLALFLVLFTRSLLPTPRVRALTGRPIVARFVVRAGVVAWAVVVAAYLVMRMWLGRNVASINAQVAILGADAPQLHAGIGNGFVLIWVAQAFAAVPVTCALTRFHMRNSDNAADEV